MLSLGNKQFEGVYLFGGDRSTAAPFVEDGGGVKFVGSENVLENQYDENSKLSFMVDGSQVFGALSTRVQGSVDLSPALAATTRIAELKCAIGDGEHLGSMLRANAPTSVMAELSHAD